MPQRTDDARPLIVVAEREPVVEDGFRIMDVAVMLYRLRWKVVGVWVICMAAVVALGANAPAFEWRMEIDLQPGPQSTVQAIGLEPIALIAGQFSDISCDFAKITAAGKPEVIRTHLFISVPSADDSRQPKPLVALRSAADEWIADQQKRFLERQSDTVAIARERLAAVSQDRAATAIDARAAAALALAQAESSLKFPPVWKMSECVVEPVKPAGPRTWATRAAGALAAAFAVVLALEGWSRVRVAARAAR